MSEMVDIVAAALSPVGWPRTDINSGDREAMRAEARTAIGAMREPTPAMLEHALAGMAAHAADLVRAGRADHFEMAKALTLLGTGETLRVVFTEAIDEALR